VQRCAARDEFTLAACIRVAHLTASPVRLIHPRIVAGVTRQWLGTLASTRGATSIN
jgi:hypothetical protein